MMQSKMNESLNRVETILQKRWKTDDADVSVRSVDHSAEHPVVAAQRERAWRGRWPKVVPHRFVEASLDDLDDDTGQRLSAWAGDTNVLLTGGFGVGKTHAAVALARREYLDRERSVVFASTVKLLDQLRPGDQATVGVYDAAVKSDILILDDLGTEKATEWVDERLYAIVNERWMEQRPIIATSNLMTRDELVAGLGERLMSRLGHEALVVGLGGKDRRR